MTTTETPATRTRKAWTPEANLEAASVLRLLMVKPWLCAGRDDDAIAAVRRNLDAVRAAFARLGWVVVVERDLVRLRKTPPARLTAFTAPGPSSLACQWLFLLVAASESMGRRVRLGALVTAARSAAAEAGVATTGNLIERRAIITALKMLSERGVLEQLDGDVEGYLYDENAPVLLEIHHTRLLHVIANYAPVDPVSDPAGWLAAVTRESDPARRMRRRLVDDAVVHTTDLDPAEVEWMNKRVSGDDGGPLAAAFGLHSERRREGAAFVLDDESFRHQRQFGEVGPLAFPGTGTVAHAAYLVCAWVNGTGNDVVEGPSGWRGVAADAVTSKLAEFAAEQAAGRGGWARELAEDPGGRLRDEVLALLTGLDLVRLDGSDTWLFSPATARWRRSFTPSAPPRRRPAADNLAFDFGDSDDSHPA